MNGAQYILKFLEQHGCSNAFGYPGGAIMPLYDALLDSSIQHYLARHEQGAAFAAIGHARSNNQVGVCFGTSGPGATNLLTSIADAKLDSVPLLVITGQVATSAMGSDAFQEVDVLGLSLSITKHSSLVRNTKELPAKLAEAFAITTEGRPGPVLLDIPKDVLLSPCPAEMHLVRENNPIPDAKDQANVGQAMLARQFERANQLIQAGEKPLLYVGGGVAMADALDGFRQFLSASNLPVVSTLKGLGTVPKHYPLHLGMLGMHGWTCANHAVQSCDVLIVLGARLDDRATGKLDEFAPNAKLIHIDIDAAELDKRREATVAIQADANSAVSQLAPANPSTGWLQQISDWQQEAAFQYRIDTSEPKISAESLLRYISDTMPNDAIICCDVGQHQMWAAQHMQFDSPRNHLTSGGLGTMGFGMPAAIGAQIANPGRTVIAVCGDGSFMMNIQELATLKRYGVPVKILLLDNQRLGMVKQWQELFHQERYSETDLSDNPEFAAVAAAFGIHSDELNHSRDIEHKIQQFLNTDGPTLLHVRLCAHANVWPIVPPNTANHKMMEKHHAVQN